MSDSLQNEINEIKGTVVPEVKWLKDPYVGTIRITDVIVSEDVKSNDGKPYTGTPFFKFVALTRTKENVTLLFWRTTKDDSPEKATAKKEKLKKFLDNVGVDSAITDPRAYLKSAIGKYVETVLKLQEEWYTDETGCPRIRNKVIYSFSQKYKEPITINDISKLTIPLNEKDAKDYANAIAAYEQLSGQKAPAEPVVVAANPETAVSPESKSGEDDLPF